MELKTNSVSARVYREVYNTKNMPESLCPYFWRLVLAYPLIVVLLPLLIPTWIIMNIHKDGYESDFPIGAKTIMGVLIYSAILIILMIGVFISSYWVTYYQKTTMYSLFISGGFISIILSMTGIILGVKHLYQQRKRKYNVEYGEEKPNLIVEIVKAKYNKYCPKITWK